jgi:hypothetical protein
VPLRKFSIRRKLYLIYPRGPRPTGGTGAFAELVLRAAASSGGPGRSAITSAYDT